MIYGSETNPKLKEKKDDKSLIFSCFLLCNTYLYSQYIIDTERFGLIIWSSSAVYNNNNKYKKNIKKLQSSL